ncbi:hypothetical protein N0V90_003855 [Kalmusia sp. IMI 367209]|nr:hypothetical protein N0V90_003855 [Kalmusia sp. IMI 367209]
MQRGLMPGVASGANAWAQWGAKEIALAERMKKVDHDVYDVDSPAGPTPQAENWEDQVRAVLTDRVHDDTTTPEISTTRSGSCLSERKQEVKVKKWEVEEDDDWMYGGMKDFGGTEHCETAISS